MPTKFDDYVREIEEKIKAEGVTRCGHSQPGLMIDPGGPEAVARWEAFNTHFAMVRDEISYADAEAEAVAVERIRSGATQRTRGGETVLAELGIDVCQH